MATVNDEQLVTEIKTRLGITGDYQNALILAYANDAKDYMIGAGVDDGLITNSLCVGCIARGVADLWNLGSGDGKFSEIFYQRTIQLIFELNEEI